MPADRKPIPLMGIQRGGHTVDGQSVMFEFESQGGKTFPFTCRHEAVSGIVDILLGLAERENSTRRSGHRDHPRGHEQKHPGGDTSRTKSFKGRSMDRHFAAQGANIEAHDDLGATLM
jgi:hypothetical protein